METTLLSSRRRWTALFAGLLLPQFILYGPSLFGDKLLLPLEALRGAVYLPAGAPGLPPAADDAPGDTILSDAVLQFEPQRQYAASQIRAGHIPLWDPLNYAGAPFLASNQPAVFSPLRLLDYLWTSPRAVAWREVLKALIAGVGAFLFFSRALGASFWAAAFGAWCFPLCGFLVLWANHPHSSVAIWLPWLLWLTEGALQRPRGPAPIGLALAVAAALQSGHAGVAAHLLIGSGLYALGRLAADLSRVRALPALLAGWLAGAMLSAAQTLPTLDYLRGSARIAERLGGAVETAPAGLHALVQLLLPYAFGASGERLVYLAPGNRLESAAAGYTGLLVALCLAPAGLLPGKRRGFAWAMALFAAVGIAQIVDLPLLGALLMRPPLATLRNHRLVLLTGFAILSLAVLGLDALLEGERPPRWVRWSCLAALPVLAVWSAARAARLPEPFAKVFSEAQARAAAGEGSAQLARVLAAGPRLVELSIAGACVSLAALVFVALVFVAPQPRRRLLPILCAASLLELIWMARGVNPQRDRALYYPPVPALAAIRAMPWGRAVCMSCLPANLGSMLGLSDARGYDGADPIRMVQLLELFRAKGSGAIGYARVQWWRPDLASPLVNLLGLRYLVGRGAPRAGSQPIARSPDYFVLENRDALPRAFVPEHWAVERDEGRRLHALADPAFDPRKLAWIEEPIALDPMAAAHGRATVLGDSGDRLSLEVSMDTPGLLVIIDSWDDGWRGFADGVEVPVLRADHALRAVALPAGHTMLELRYEPQSFQLGVNLAGAAALILLLWLLWTRVAARAHGASSSTRASRVGADSSSTGVGTG